MKKFLGCVLALSVLLAGCGTGIRTQTDQPAAQPARGDPRRGVWVSYMEVARICRGTVQDVRQAIDEVVGNCRALCLTDIFWHVRANSDAAYPSAIFPMTGEVSALTAAGFDPFSQVIGKAHEAGIRVHAWINPYRVGSGENAVSNAVFSYQDKVYYIPTEPEVQRRVLDGVREIVGHYAVDGVHFDDYFYPAGSVDADTPAPFESDRFNAGNGQTVGDWRRAAVTRLVSAAHDICKANGRVFGVSPSYRLEATRDTMYADIALWMTNGSLDYICPQLYVGFQNEYAPFAEILKKWAALPRAEGTALIAGIPLYKAGIREDAYAGSGRFEWGNGGYILASQLRAVEEDRSYTGFVLYSYSYLFSASEQSDENVAREERENVKNELTKTYPSC